MNNFNYLDNYSSLQRWEKDLNKISTENNLKETNFNLSNININKIKSLIKKNKFLLIPPLSIIGLTFIVFVVSIFPRLNVWRLSSRVNLFNAKYMELEESNNQIVLISNSLSKHLPTFDIKSPVLLFSHFIQTSIPEEVSISDYSLDNKRFIINASSDDIEKINLFINTINQIPLVEKDSLQVKKLVDSSASQSNQSTLQTSNLGKIVLEINGNLSRMSFEEKIKYQQQIYNFGEVRKLEQLLNLINTFKL